MRAGAIILQGGALGSYLEYKTAGVERVTVTLPDGLVAT
jgi:hypothetical protein